MTKTELHLRPVAEADLVVFDRFATDPSVSAPYEWPGFPVACLVAQTMGRGRLP